MEVITRDELLRRMEVLNSKGKIRLNPYSHRQPNRKPLHVARLQHISVSVWKNHSPRTGKVFYSVMIQKAIKPREGGYRNLQLAFDPRETRILYKLLRDTRSFLSRNKL